MAAKLALALGFASALLLSVQDPALAQSDSAPPAETQTALAPAEAASDQPAPLTEDEIPMVRTALYPDEFVAVISAASRGP